MNEWMDEWINEWDRNCLLNQDYNHFEQPF